MELSSCQIWIILLIIFFIGEILYPTFLCLCISLGCLFAGLGAFFFIDLKLQLLFFSVGVLIGFFGARPFMIKFLYLFNDKTKTYSEALVGKIGKISETVDNSINKGRGIFDGVDWRVESDDNQILLPGENVLVLKVNSTILIVSAIKR